MPVSYPAPVIGLAHAGIIWKPHVDVTRRRDTYNHSARIRAADRVAGTHPV